MIRSLIRNWWLLALCGLLEAIYSATNLVMQGPDGTLTWRTFAVRSTVKLLGKFALTAGVCAIAAGMWHAKKGRSWHLALKGLTLCALGAILIFWRGPLAFRTVALLLVVMAVSIGIFALATAPTLRRHVPEQWFLKLAGVVSVGFALAFFALGFRWIIPEQPASLFVWMSAYFGFSAVCMLGLGLRLNRLRPRERA